MRTNFLVVTILLLLFGSCTENAQKSANDKVAINSQSSDTETKKVELNNKNPEVRNDTPLLVLGDSIVKLFKIRNYAGLTQFIDPQSGLRFSPYGVVDTSKNHALSASQIIELAKNKKTIKWGTFEGTGEPIELTVDGYIKRFVYDVDYLGAEKKSINKIIGQDSSLSNIKAVYPRGEFVQYYFSGFKQAYQGMDWKSLVLVFKRANTRTFLVAIIHNQWKI